MRIGEVARQAGVTVKAVRYYESLGLVTAARQPNGYRAYDDGQLRRIVEIRDLGRLEFTAERTRPFLDCLEAGGASGDACPASLDAYRDAIADLADRVDQLSQRRDQLVERLARATARASSSPAPAGGVPAPRCDLTAVPEEL